MTKVEVKAMFCEDVLPFILKQYGDDETATWEAWNNYTDRLCKGGQITDYQYSNWIMPNFSDKDKLNAALKEWVYDT